MVPLFNIPPPTTPTSHTGATALTLTPEWAHSMAKLLVKLSTAALAAPVWLSDAEAQNFSSAWSVKMDVNVEADVAYAMPGKPLHMSAIMLTITPPCCFIHAV